MDADEFRKRGKEMIDYVADYMENIRDRSAVPSVEPGYLEHMIPSEAPEEGEPWEDIMEDVERVIMPGIASPSCTELEVVVMDWLAKVLKLPEDFLSSGKGGGVIQGSASESVHICLLAAKAKTLKQCKDLGMTDEEILSKLVAYGSDQTHSSLERACQLAYVKYHEVESNEKEQMQGDRLAAAIAKDKQKGLIPFFVVATLGTTPTCAFDQLINIGPVCNEEGVWLHVDAAYAGSTFICPEFRPLLDGVEFASSFNFNPFKMIMISDGSALWLKDSSHLVDAFHVDREYLNLKHEIKGKMPDYRHWQIPLGGKFRSLKFWFVIRSYGIKGLQNHIRKHVSLAREFETFVKNDDILEVTNEVKLGLVCFRIKGVSNEVNRKLLQKINSDGRLLMIAGESNGKYFIRLVVCSPLAKKDDIEGSYNIIKELARCVLKEENGYSAATVNAVNGIS